MSNLIPHLWDYQTGKTPPPPPAPLPPLVDFAILLAEDPC